MGFWVMFLIALAVSVVGELLRPKQKFNSPKPSGLGDFQFPTADSTRVIPVFWGTCKMKGPNTTWFGDLKTAAIQKKVKTGWFSSDKVTQGIEYYLGVQVVFCFGEIDELIDFRMDEKTVIDNVNVVNGTHNYSFIMNKPTLLGNEEPENGVRGPVRLYKGTRTQPADPYLQAQWGETSTSGFRPLCYAVFQQCYLGNSDTPPPPTLIARRTPNPLTLINGAHNIAGDANPACMVYEVMTDPLWGINLSPDVIDIESMRACAYVLANEGMGLSLQIETATSGRSLLAEFLRHIDGVVYPDPKTGLYTMALARDDYDVNDIEEFDNSNILPNTFEFSRMSWEETKNTTIVNYTDRERDFTAQPVPYQDTANVFVRKGQIDSEQIEFLGFSNKTQALKAAARASKTSSSPHARIQFATDRSGYSLRPAQVIKVSKPDFGMSGLIMRVVDVRYGTLKEPRVVVTCVEDIFTVNALAFSTPIDSGWVPTYVEPLPLRRSRTVEVPYEMIDREESKVMALGVRDDFVTQGFEVWSDSDGDATVTYRKTGKSVGTIPSGVLTAAYPISAPLEDATGFIVEGMTDGQRLASVSVEDRNRGIQLLLIDDEIMAYQTVAINPLNGAATITNIVRGVYDTVPATHAAGAPVYFFDETIPLTDAQPYVGEITLWAKLPPYNGPFSLALTALPALSLALTSRALRPNPPGNFQINGVRGDIATAASGEVLIDWSLRNKKSPGITSQTAGDVEPEQGAAVSIKIFNASTNALLLEAERAYGSSARFGLTQAGNVRVELRSITFDGKVSRNAQIGVIAYTAPTATSYLNASDDLLTPDEKSRVIMDRDAILAEQSGINVEAASYGVVTERTAYNAAITALTTYLATLTLPVPWDDVSGYTVVVDAEFRGKFLDVFNARQALLNAILAKAKTLTAEAIAQETLDRIDAIAAESLVLTTALADEAATRAASAATLAQQIVDERTARQAAIAAAQLLITRITDDSILSADEKPALIRELQIILDERPGILVEAAASEADVEAAAYDAAVDALVAYLSTLTTPVAWNDTSSHTILT